MGLIHNGNGEMIPGERGGKVRPCESAWQEPDDRSEQLPRSQRPATQKFFIRPTILAGTVAGGTIWQNGYKMILKLKWFETKRKRTSCSVSGFSGFRLQSKRP